MANTTGTT